MATGTASFRHFVLGLLARKPMSGYDIKRFLERLGWLIGSFSFGHIYPTLHGLLGDRLVDVHVVSSSDKPPKKVYSINERGRQELQEWTDQQSSSEASVRSFAMGLILAGSLSSAGLFAHLRQRRDQVASNHAALQQMLSGIDQGADLGRRMALGYGLAMARAEAEWLDVALDELAEGSCEGEAAENVELP